MPGEVLSVHFDHPWSWAVQKDGAPVRLYFRVGNHQFYFGWRDCGHWLVSR